MKEIEAKITSFTDLSAWKEAHRLALMIYRATDKFPSRETHGLSNQMRRSAVSITSNIAEGFSRNTVKDKYQFYVISYGSLTELQSQMLLSRDLNFLPNEIFKETAAQSVVVAKLLNGLKRIKNNSSTKYKIQDTEYKIERG